MDHVSIVELAEKAGVPSNTVILYLSMFEDFFSRHRLIEGKKHYPPEKADLIRTIHQLYQRQRYTKQEIREKLLEDFPDDMDSNEPADSTKHLEKALEKLTREIQTFNHDGLPGLVKSVNQLSENIKQASSLLSTPHPHAAGQTKPSMLDILLTTKLDDPPDDPDLEDIINLAKRLPRRSAGKGGVQVEPIHPRSVDNTLSFESSSEYQNNDLPEGSTPDQLEIPGNPGSQEEVIETVLSLSASGMNPEEIVSTLKKQHVAIISTNPDLEL